jgi:hypothetical protein
VQRIAGSSDGGCSAVESLAAAGGGAGAGEGLGPG